MNITISYCYVFLSPLSEVKLSYVKAFVYLTNDFHKVNSCCLFDTNFMICLLMLRCLVLYRLYYHFILQVKHKISINIIFTI